MYMQLDYNYEIPLVIINKRRPVASLVYKLMLHYILIFAYTVILCCTNRKHLSNVILDIYTEAVWQGF